jgi:hypothetical protein
VSSEIAYEKDQHQKADAPMHGKDRERQKAFPDECFGDSGVSTSLNNAENAIAA